jgi:endonuclease G
MLMLALVSFATNSAQGQTLKIAHCLAGCPAGGNSNDLILRPVYALSYDHQARMAQWAAYIVTAGSIGVATNLSREPMSDPFIEDAMTAQDYQTLPENMQRQTLVPLVSFAGTPYWSDINYMTNMVPRNSELNRGSWYGLEWAVRNLANRADELYVVSGPIFEFNSNRDQILAGEQQIPSAFFKVVATRGGQMAAFLFNQDLPFHVHHCEQLTSLAVIENLTGLDLFPERSDWPAGDLSERLGCF